MDLSRTDTEQLAAFPPVLQALLQAELAAGNTIVEIASCFPAPPAGAYVKLARPITTRPRASGDGIDFYDRNSSSYSGEITDAKRFYFILEPPHPPEPEPDMQAIRAGLEARQRAADEELRAVQARQARAEKAERRVARQPSRAAEPAAASASQPATRFARFRASMAMDLERWREGIGYDLSLLEGATPAERAEIATFLEHRTVEDWRDVEALAAIDTPRARELLLRTLKSGRSDLAEAVTRHAPHLVADAERTRVLVELLEHGEIYGGLTQALAQVAEYHPPEIVGALLRGLLARRGDSGIPHYAALLLFIHGRAESDMDWGQRPFWIQFATDDRAERERLFRELCTRIGVDPEPYLRAVK